MAMVSALVVEIPSPKLGSVSVALFLHVCDFPWMDKKKLKYN